MTVYSRHRDLEPATKRRHAGERLHHYQVIKFNVALAPKRFRAKSTRWPCIILLATKRKDA